MAFEILATARNWSVILLALEFLVLGAVPLIILYVITRWLRGVVRQTRPFLQQVAGYVYQGLAAIDGAMTKVAAPFLWLHMRHAMVMGFWKRWERGISRGTSLRSAPRR